MTVSSSTGISTTATSSSSTASSSSTTSVASGQASLNSSYQSFLALLTAQLQNQDPLNPTDSSQFTSELVQMNGVQQQLLTNSLLQSLVSASTSNLSTGASYIGKTVLVDDSSQTLSSDGSSATWGYTLPSTAATASATVTNSGGVVIYSQTLTGSALNSGENSFTWNGQDSSGNPAPAGTYTLNIQAKDSSGTAITATPNITGTVTAATTVSGSTYLNVGGSQVLLSNVVGVQ